MNLSNPDVRAMITLTRKYPVVSGYRPAHTLEAGMRLIFQEGERVTGYAEILEVCNELLRK